MDLVREASTGFTFDPFNTEQMADLMSRISSNPGDLVVMGKAAQTMISNWDWIDSPVDSCRQSKRV